MSPEKHRSSSSDWELISFLAVLVGFLVHELMRHSTDPGRTRSDLVMVSGLITNQCQSLR
jgi:hypothetical protein